MSSFKRRGGDSSAIPGTRLSPYNSLRLLSTGLPSLDDILGGGLPLSSQLLLESDEHSAYADLLLKIWVAQGLQCRQDVMVVGSSIDNGGSAADFVRQLPGAESDGAAHEEEDGSEKARNEKMKIAFRYEGMKQHATTISEPRSISVDTYCSVFDLTANLPFLAHDERRTTLLDVESITSTSEASDVYDAIYDKIEKVISNGSFRIDGPVKPQKALRIAIRSLGGPSWPEADPSALYRFLLRLRHLLRQSSASTVITFPASHYRNHHTSRLVTMLEWASDGVVELQSFAGNDELSALFPKHSGILRIPKLPSLNSLVPPSAKLSVLRGIGAGQGQANVGGAANNLGFRVKRKRFIIETLDADGPVGFAPPPKAEKTNVKPDPAGPAGPGKSAAATSKVRFASTDPDAAKPTSASSMLHSRPELFEF